MKIFTKLSSLNDLGRKNWNTGYNGNKYYVISSENKLEIFEVMFDGITPQEIFMRLDEQAFDEEVIKLQNTAVCIFQEQYFRNTKYKKEKLYPKPDIL